MARNVSRGDLRDQVRLRPDIQNEVRRFPDSELNYYINEGIAQFHAEMVRARGQGFSEATTSFATVNGQELYALPAALLEVVKVWTRIDGIERDLHSYEEWDTQGLVEPQSINSSYSNFGYRISGDNISIRPIPSDVLTIRIKYITTAIKLTNDASTLDGVDGLEEFVILWAARRVALKNRDEFLIAALKLESDEMLERLRAIQPARNAAEAPRLGDVRQDKLSWRRWSRRFPPA